MSGPWGASGLSKTLMKDSSLISEVHIDGLALLKIIKHCTEALPNMVAGSLLGLDQKNVLEVTHSFPHPSAKKEDILDSGWIQRPQEEAPHLMGQNFQIEMMKMMREVNVDNNCVGWYQSMYLGSFCTQTLVDNQFTYQENLSNNSIVILYDPVQTARGQLTVKAYRLSQEFMKSYRNPKSESMKPSEILDEIPVKIRNSAIANALVYDLQDRGTTECDFDRLDLSTNPFLEKNLEFLCGWVDDLAAEQMKYQNYAKTLQSQRQDQSRWGDRKKKGDDKREDGADDETSFNRRQETPNRLESLLISKQISTYCQQVNKFTSSSFEKLFLAGSLQRDTS